MTDEIILIDAFSQIFRAYFAIRQLLTNSQGTPTNAVYVFTKLLMKLDADYPAKYGALLFDCGKPAFRLELAPEYKANRPPMPEPLKVQLPLIREMAEAFGWPQFSAQGYEADDLIGGFATHTDLPVRIVSGDKDLSQLIDDRISMLVPGAKNSFEVRGIAECQEKFQVPPALIADYLAILGDTSDNIPGVNGIGAKGAAALLNEFGPSEGWLDSIEKTFAKSKFLSKLSGQEKLLRKNLQLVRLRTELPEAYRKQPTQQLRRHQTDWAKVRVLCEKLELKNILKELPESEELPLFSVQETPASNPEMEQGTLF